MAVLSRWTGVLMLLGCMAAPAQAMELKLDVAPVWWSYSESAGAIPGFASTPLSSKVQGWGVESRLAMDGGFSDTKTGWRWSLDLRGLSSLKSRKEQWTTAISQQTNSFKVAEWETRGELAYAFKRVRFGVWSSYMQHVQKRSAFVVNGVPTPVAGEPVAETVRVNWVGLNIYSRNQRGPDLATTLEVAAPVRIKTENPLAGNFRSKKGFAAMARIEWFASSHLSLYGSYRMRRLGGETTAIGHWPENRWQAVSLGVAGIW